MRVRLVTPDKHRLPAFVDALERGWSPDNLRGEAAAREALARIAEDADAFLAHADDPEGKAGNVTLPDGATVPRLPGLYRWLWDGEFCGLIGLRWNNDGPQLPAYVLGHVGYSVVPWKRGRGYATRALAMILPMARARGLPYIELTTDEDNIASQKVIVANGGRLLGAFPKPQSHRGAPSLKFRIDLDSRAFNGQ
jgi:predicted acetyltransferase